MDNAKVSTAAPAIDWKKPLRAVYEPGQAPAAAQKVYTFKSGKQRVIWVDDRVFPVDDSGHAAADVNYGSGYYAVRGEQLVENVSAPVCRSPNPRRFVIDMDRGFPLVLSREVMDRAKFVSIDGIVIKSNTVKF